MAQLRLQGCQDFCLGGRVELCEVVTAQGLLPGEVWGSTGEVSSWIYPAQGWLCQKIYK